MNFYSSIETVFIQNPDKELLTTVAGKLYSNRNIAAQTACLANFMVSIGIKPGDRVSAQIHKSVENLCLYLACLQAGFVFHPLNPAYKCNELDYFLGNAEPALVVCDPDNLEMIRELVNGHGIAHLETLDKNGEGSLTEHARTHSIQFETVARKGEDLATLLYSSGTTGQPKGIMLSHDNLRSNAECLVKAWDFTSSDRLLHCLPIFHVHGLFVALGCVLLSGASMCWLEGFSTSYVKTYLPECTSMMGVPTYYTRLLEDPEFSESHCENIRLFTSGSAPLLTETFIAFEKLTGHTILERYGMTETGMNCSNPLDGVRKPGTVGPALPDIVVRIVDDNSQICPLNTIGNLQVKGENVFQGYWHLPEKTEEDFTKDGFFNTGDQATIDADDYVSIVGRSKDMVITGGLNVYPKEIEDVLDQIDGVLESTVIGVSHPDFGEAVVAVIVPLSAKETDASSIITYAKNRLADFKVPKHVHFINALPRNTMGKVQKKALRGSLKDLFVV